MVHHLGLLLVGILWGRRHNPQMAGRLTRLSPSPLWVHHRHPRAVLRPRPPVGRHPGHPYYSGSCCLANAQVPRGFWSVKHGG